DSDPAFRAGAFLQALVNINPTASGWNPDSGAAAKATLDTLSAYEESWGKANLGTTDATGGWIIPNAIVDDIIKPATFLNPYRELMTVVNGVTSSAVDLPFRS